MRRAARVSRTREFLILNSEFFILHSPTQPAGGGSFPQHPLNSPIMSSSLAPAACPRCSGSGWVPIGGDSLRVEACGCQPDLRRRQRIDGAHIPKRYLHCRLENFHDRNHGALVAGRRTVQEFVDCWPRTAHGKGLIIMGGCGVGKTHLAVAALMEIIHKTKSGRFLFTNFQELIQEIQASFDNDAVPSKSEILRPVIDADLLVLDELGSQ